MEDRPLSYREKNKDFEALLKEVQQHPHPVGLILDRIENNRNLGAMFRIADSARLKGLFAFQMDAKLAESKKLKRVSRMTHQHIPLVQLNELEEIRELKKTHRIYALEITQQSIPYTELKPEFPCLLIIGNEKYGVAQELLQLADASIHIPMHGVNLSMNVSVATGIATFKLLEYLSNPSAERRES
ncbi:MAG: TrmH family RNA methyltransferase [Saprospiraceae bacterium]|nr:TrmH family RNA methyltransferase [Saprospiraceae bacterium]